MKTKNYLNLKIWIIPIVGLVIAVISLFFLPDHIPIHWDNTGNTQMASRYTILLVPAISMAVLALGHIVPVIDPKKEAYGQAARPYTAIHFIIMMLLLAVELFVIMTSLGVDMDAGTFAYLAASVVIAAVGNYIPKIPPTYLTGVKTVWGYKNDAVWVKTQRFAGRLWFAGGLLLMILAFLRLRFPVNLIIIAVLVVAPRIYGLIITVKNHDISC